MAQNESLKNLARRLAQADLPFYLLPPIMLCLVLGTVAQRDMGLYAAQKMFFGSFIIWAGPLPLPGFYILTAALTISLLLKFILNSEWTARKTGINLSHLGVLVLLAGGLTTALTAREGYMLIYEGDSSPYVYDYTKRELFIFENDHLLATVPFEKLKSFNLKNLPFEISVKDVCENCAINKREDENKNYNGMARFMALSEKALEKEPEKNITGLTFELKNTNKDGAYIAFEGMPEPIEITGKNKRAYKIIFGRQQRLLPFTIKLVKFTKENYPGTQKARAFSSDLLLTDGKASWPARTEMNAPLRYKGYTFYQSSFEQSAEGQATILSVVENKGRLFPYIGTALVAIGLLLHLWLMTQKSGGRV